jgi:hypothetical protein
VRAGWRCAFLSARTPAMLDEGRGSASIEVEGGSQDRLWRLGFGIRDRLTAGGENGDAFRTRRGSGVWLNRRDSKSRVPAWHRGFKSPPLRQRVLHFSRSSENRSKSARLRAHFEIAWHRRRHISGQDARRSAISLPRQIFRWHGSSGPNSGSRQGPFPGRFAAWPTQAAAWLASVARQ